MTSNCKQTPNYDVETDFIAPNIEASEGIHTIKNAIKDRLPFSFTRFCEGEAAFLKGVANIVPPEQLERHWKKWHKFWGVTRTSETEKMIEGIFKEGFRSDLIGINIKNRWCRISPTYLTTKNQLVCYSMIVRNPAIGNPRTLDSLLQGVPARIITNRRSILAYIQRYSTVPLGLTFMPFSLTIYQFQEKLQKLDFPEQVVLWGCGAGAKNMGVYLRDKLGKTCIDMGSVLDAWSGIASRNGFKGNSLCLAPQI